MMKRSVARLCEGTAVKLESGKFNPSAQWNFWDPVWGGKWNAQFEGPYHTRTMMGSNFRVPKPGDGTPGCNAPYHAQKSTLHNGIASNADMRWAARRTPASAIEVEATTVTCQGTGASVNNYFTPRANTTFMREQGTRHHMQWIFVPPDRAVCCMFCGIHFKRKSGWAPSFDENLSPEIGDIPVGGSLDPCLANKKKGEAVDGAVKL